MPPPTDPLDLPDPDDINVADASRVHVVEVVDAANVTEIFVPIELVERPEVQLFLEVATYLKDKPDRVPLLSFSTAYVQSVIPVLMGQLVYGPPIEEEDDGRPDGPGEG